MIEVETQALLADYITVAAAAVAALQDVTDLGLARIDLIVEDITTGFAVTAGSNVDVGATFSGILYNKGGAKASLKVPGIKADLVSIDGTVDIQETDVAAYLALYEQDGGTLLLSDGEQIDTWLSGVLDR
jgi:citrate lyase alpha subunit